MVGSKKISMECFMCLFPFFGVFVDKRVSMQRHFDVKSELSIVRGGLKWAFKTLSNIWTEILSDLPCPLNPGWRIGHTNQARKLFDLHLTRYLTTKTWRICNTNQANQTTCWSSSNKRPNLFKLKSCSKPVHLFWARYDTIFSKNVFSENEFAKKNYLFKESFLKAYFLRL